MEHPLGSPPASVSAGGGTSFLAAMDLFHRCLNQFGVSAAAATAGKAQESRRLVLVLLSDGETSPTDYAAAKARLLNASLLLRLTSYSSVHVLLVGIGASRWASV